MIKTPTMRKKTYIVLFMGLLLFTGCKDFLTDVQPTDQLPIEAVFNTAADLDAAMIGAYDAIQHGDALGRNIPSLADLMAYNAFGYFEEVSTLQMEPDHWITERLWAQSYRAINQVNAILEALPIVAAKDARLTQEQASRLEGEALFIRAVLHFELVRLYALPYPDFPDEKGVPLMLSAVLKKENLQFPARASVKEVYVQVEADLEKAVTLLPESSAPWKINRFTAKAYLARIAFQKRDYASAALLAGEIVNSGRYVLAETPEAFYTEEGTSEEIWTIPSSPDDGIEDFGLSSVYNDAPTTAAISPDLRENGYASIVPAFQLASLQTTYPGTQVFDLRCDPNGILSAHPIVLNDMTGDTTRCNKYENSWLAEEDDTPNTRLVEFILMYAEALVRTQGLNSESIELLNQIRRRSLRVVDGNGQVISAAASFLEFEFGDFQNQDQLIEAIILERRVELAFEGNYLHDLMRLKRDVRNGQKTYPYNAKELRLPIPQRDIDANPNLAQNP